MTYEAATDILLELARFYWLQPRRNRPQLSREEKLILITKVLQGRAWERVADVLNTSPHRVMVKLKEISRKMAKHYYNLTEESPTGISLSELIGRHNSG